MTLARISAPAKVNLGLSILGKRPDGYHDIDTILAMIDLSDEIILHEGVVSGISISGMENVPLESNLITKAIQLWCDEAMVQPNWHVEITKHIPSPAGLGGGSSNAAAILKALNVLHGDLLSDVEMHQIASELGTDCPYFLGSATARATGTGTQLSPLPAPTGYLVLAVPESETEAKTATLYSRLNPHDYGSSAEIDAIEARIRSGDLSPTPFPNSFSQAARSLFTKLEDLERLFIDVTGTCTLSGAGPALFAIATSEAEAAIWARHLRAELEDDVQVFTSAFLQNRPVPEVEQ